MALKWVVRRRTRGDLLARALVLGGLVAFVLIVYVAVVLGGGVLVGETSSPQVGLSVLATVIVALGFGRVRAWLEDLTLHTVRGGRPTAYEVLNRFSTTATGSSPVEELPARMAMVLAEGTGAAWAQVRLVVDGRLRLAATWPPDAQPADLPDRDAPADVGRADDSPARSVGLPVIHTREVGQGGEVLGELVIQERESVPLTPVEERLFAGLANQAGLVLRAARLRAQLELRASELASRAEELRRSRERLVDAQDAARRRLERDIHDGAQQHLVALAVNLRLAATLSTTSPDRADRILAEQDSAAADTIETIQNLSRGIYPRRLSLDGLGAALEAISTRSPIPVVLRAEGVARYPAAVEAAAYFCALEALQNCVKHSGATRIEIAISTSPDTLTVVVEDNGVGFDQEAGGTGTGIANMVDRVDALGGSLLTTSKPGHGTRMCAQLVAAPLSDPDPLVDSAPTSSSGLALR